MSLANRLQKAEIILPYKPIKLLIMSSFTDMMIDDGFNDPQEYMDYLESLAWEYMDKAEREAYDIPPGEDWETWLETDDDEEETEDLFTEEPAPEETTSNTNNDMTDYKIPLEGKPRIWLHMEIAESYCYRIDKEPGEEDFYIKIMSITEKEEFRFRLGKFRGAFKKELYFTESSDRVWIIETREDSVVLRKASIPFDPNEILPF